MKTSNRIPGLVFCILALLSFLILGLGSIVQATVIADDLDVSGTVELDNTLIINDKDVVDGSSSQLVLNPVGDFLGGISLFGDTEVDGTLLVNDNVNIGQTDAFTNLTVSGSTNGSTAAQLTLKDSSSGKYWIVAHRDGTYYQENNWLIFYFKNGTYFVPMFSLDPLNNISKFNSDVIVDGDLDITGQITGNLDVADAFNTAAGTLTVVPQDATSAGGQIVLEGSSTYSDWTVENSGGQLQFFQSGLRRMQMEEDGNLIVGFSNTYTDAQMEIINAGPELLRLKNSNFTYNGNIAGKLTFVSTTPDSSGNPTKSSGSVQIRSIAEADPSLGWAPTGLALHVGSNWSPPERLRITSTGKVGIGTSTPKELLQVGEMMTFHDGGWKGIGFNSHYVSGSGWKSIVDGYSGSLIWNTDDGDFQFRSGPNVSSEELTYYTIKMIIKNNGTVAIGTTTPDTSQKLHVAGNAKIEGALTIEAQGDIPMFGQ